MPISWLTSDECSLYTTIHAYSANEFPNKLSLLRVDADLITEPEQKSNQRILRNRESACGYTTATTALLRR